ncbi:DNA polymerase III subunit gamma/tau [Buchnera aphidicola]|uniref:DNA polymerase III subunit gamma/tau n=1 Tax=Buchnera aphidicola TaxID=9 RepID=UPI00346426A9
MNYQILANKWRPKSFKEIIGHQDIITAILHGFQYNKIHQAWILSGTRGIGKTTIARLLSKTLNCTNRIDSYSCNICSNCQDIEKKTFPDIIEIDAASKTRVEDIKELLETIQYLPIKGKYKIYLIDEVHMLSKHSFNALLKNLEEPPKYAKFILITTEINKIPETILSRCMYFHLKPINIKKIKNHLINILIKENINFEKEALEIIAENAKGSIRDALNIIEQAILINYNNITKISIIKMFGILDKEQILEIFTTILKKKNTKLFNLLKIVYESNIDLDQILIGILNILHNIIIIKNMHYTNNSIHSQYKKKIFQMAKLLNYKELKNYYKIIITGRKELSFSPNVKIGVEITLLNFLNAI